MDSIIRNRENTIEKNIAHLAVLELIAERPQIFTAKIARKMRTMGYNPTPERIQRAMDRLISELV
jgi:uncharacterized protein YneF (UPF0154 family)